MQKLIFMIMDLHLEVMQVGVEGVEEGAGSIAHFTRDHSQDEESEVRLNLTHSQPKIGIDM
jgi:hypothetical protein